MEGCRNRLKCEEIEKQIRQEELMQESFWRLLLRKWSNHPVTLTMHGEYSIEQAAAERGVELGHSFIAL